MVLNKNEGEIERLMREGQASAKRGDKAMARTLLTQLLELEPDNEQAWMWLSGAVTDLTEQQTCLENVLIINPNNAQARKGLGYIRAKSGRPSTAAFERLSGPLSMADIPAETPDMPDAITASAQPGSDSALTGGPEMDVMDQQARQEDLSLWADERSSTDHVAPFASSETGALDSTQASSMEATDPEEALTSIDSVMPFQASDDSVTSVYTGDHPAEGSPPDINMAVPEWVLNLPGQDATQNLESSQVPQTVPYVADASPISGPLTNGNGTHLAGGQATPGLEVDLNAWLDDLAASASPHLEEAQGDAATTQLGAPGTEQLAPFGPAPSGPFPSGSFPSNPFPNSDPTDFPPVGPYTANQLPSPDELPGSHESDEPGRPWYLQASDDAGAVPVVEAASMRDNVADGVGAASSSNAAPVATLECPNCQHHVPETSLACPQCRYSFFVHCPHCHELVDASTAERDAIEPCPYCSVDIDKMSLGLIATGETSPRLSAPKETEKSWVGEGLIRPTQRSGLLLSFSWLVDLVWLMIIVLMVWALTQLPTWWHLTNLYN